jgi:hypothetical protein
MHPAAKAALAAVAVAVVLAVIGVPLWVTLLVLVGVPVLGYLMLDPGQRRRLRAISRRRTHGAS